MTDLDNLKETLATAKLMDSEWWTEMEVGVPYFICILEELIRFKEENQ